MSMSLVKLLLMLPRTLRKQDKKRFLELPDDILYQVGCFLPPISKACLALSCKRLHSVYAKALGSPDIHFPRSFQRRGRKRRIRESLESERWKLLRYLENRHWRCCSRCLKLHRVTEFSKEALRIAAEKRECNLGKYAGIVELCPCIRLTYRDKVKLVDQLRLDPHRPRSVAYLDLSANSPHEYHSCTIHGPQTFFTRQFPVLEDGGLSIVTTYEATYFAKSGDWGKVIPPRLMCPHLDAIAYLRDMRWAKFWPDWPDTVPYREASRYLICGWCKMRFGNFWAEYTSEKTLAKASFKTTRYLGRNSEVPSQAWFDQTVYCQNPPVGVDAWDGRPEGRLARFQKPRRPD